MKDRQASVLCFQVLVAITKSYYTTNRRYPSKRSPVVKQSPGIQSRCSRPGASGRPLGDCLTRATPRKRPEPKVSIEKLRRENEALQASISEAEQQVEQLEQQLDTAAAGSAAHTSSGEYPTPSTSRGGIPRSKVSPQAAPLVPTVPRSWFFTTPRTQKAMFGTPTACSKHECSNREGMRPR